MATPGQPPTLPSKEQLIAKLKEGPKAWNEWIKGLSKERRTLIDLSKANLDDCELRGIDLGGINLSHASLVSCDLYQANLMEANLTSAVLLGAFFEGAHLNGVNLQDAEIVSSEFHRADRSETIHFSNLSTALEAYSGQCARGQTGMYGAKHV